MHEILPGVLRWTWFSEPHGYMFNGHLLRLPGGAVCVDPVPCGEETLAAIARERPALVLLTNRNHTRAAGALRARTGARVAIHPADRLHAEAQGAEIDLPLEPGGELERQIAPLRVVPTPGKSPGEVALHWPERRLLLVGDALIGDPPGRARLLRPQVIDDLPRLRQSVRSLLALDFDALLVGDGEPILQGAWDRVAELVRTFDAPAA